MRQMQTVLDIKTLLVFVQLLGKLTEVVEATGASFLGPPAGLYQQLGP